MPMTRRFFASVIAALFVALVPAAVAEQKSVPEPPTPMERLSGVAKAFYRQALERPTQGLPRGQQLDELKGLLSSDLLDRIRRTADAEDMVAEMVAGGSAVGRFLGHPLLGNYEGAHDVRFDEIDIQGDRAHVMATLYYSNRDKPMFSAERFRVWTDKVEFKREYSDWVVADICFHDDCTDRLTTRLEGIEKSAAALIRD